MAEEMQTRGGYTGRYNLPFPEPEDAADVPRWVRDLAYAVEALLSGNGLDGGSVGMPTTPVGAIIAWPGAQTPADWATCAGQEYDQDVYEDLYLAVGDRYGQDPWPAPTGPGLFRVPNLTGRVLEGMADAAGATRGTALGEASRSYDAHQHGADHAHGIDDHAHDIWHGHGFDATSGVANWYHGTHWVGTGTKNIIVGNEGDPAGSPYSHVHGVGGATGGPDNRTSGGSGVTATHSVPGYHVDAAGAFTVDKRQPTLVIPYIIRVR